MRQLIAGNWKMNGLRESRAELEEIMRFLRAHGEEISCDILLCPPATLLASFAEIAESPLTLGGQDCHAEVSGAYTGSVSAEMLADLGAKAVIVGHSERRAAGEDDAVIGRKALAAERAGLMPIFCVGETEKERERGEASAVVQRQLLSLADRAYRHGAAVAYEPVWAIGTGRTPNGREISAMHEEIKDSLRKKGHGEAHLLYGGSVSPNNAEAILSLPHVEGALVGGASLRAASFIAIARASQPLP